MSDVEGKSPPKWLQLRLEQGDKEAEDLLKLWEKQQEIRQRKNLRLRSNKYLKNTYTGFDGQEYPLKVRYYQVQGVFHLVVMKRFLLGDDTGLGKTLEAIAALCHLWETKPDTKAIVLTTKSAAPQWADEFSKFTRGVRVIVCQGSAAKREKMQRAFEQSTGPTVLIAGYRSMVKDIRRVQEWEGHVLIADECFDYHTPVILADGSTELIGKIVSQKMPVEVRCWDPETGIVTSRRVVGWYKNPLRKGRRKNLLKLSFRLGDSVRVTRSHEFYMPDGTKRPAGKLRKGTAVQTVCSNTPTHSQWQVIFGSLLGDASLSHPERSLFGVCFTQSSKQGEYLRLKRDVLRSLGVSEIGTTESGYGGATVERFRLNANRAVVSTLVQDRVWRGGKKRVTADWLDRVDVLGLAFWYGDDGSLGTHVCSDGEVRHTITLNTQGFSKDEQELLAGWLRWKWEIRAQIKTSKPRSDREGPAKKAYPYLYLPAEEAAKFLALLPGALPGVEYKFPGMETVERFDINQPSLSVVTDWVVSKKVWQPPEREKYVYDIEVEGSHNYFAGGVLVSNCTVVKNPKTQVHQVVRHLSYQADRTWALTATLIKNNLMEGYGIYRVVNPELFPTTANAFMHYYCLVEMVRVANNRRVPKIVGYLPERVKEFRERIDLTYLGRPKHEVASELPALILKTIEVGLSPAQRDKYEEALEGLENYGLANLVVGEAQGHDEEVKDVTKLTSLIYCQEIVNHLGLIGCEGPSDKTAKLFDLLSEGDLAEEKVIIFSRFKKMVDILMPLFRKAKIKAVRVTGEEDGDDRRAAMAAFQDPNSDTRVICITMAGGDAINLQAAKAIIFFDTPWSAGDFIQIVGRMIRIGSTHDRCYAIHLVARGRKKTIDHRVLEVMQKKMTLIEAVIGKRLKGEGDEDFTDVIPAESSDINDLWDLLVEDAREGL